VPVLTLSEIVGEHVHGDVDFLKVDVEGHEREVLLGADWSAFRPRVIVIEATFPERWQGLLTEAAYEFAQYDGINNFYVRAEDVETLGPSLRQPATVMDYYDPWIYVDQLRAQASHIDALERELAESERRLHEASQARVPDPELISGRDLARALVRRVVSRGRRLLTRKQ
jgi:hypothetical protein